MANKESDPMEISFLKLEIILKYSNKSWNYLRNHGISPGIVSKLRYGTGHVDTRTIQKICKLLNCQPGDIMEMKKSQ